MSKKPILIDAVSVKIGGKRKSCLSGIDTTWVNIGDFGEIVIFAIFAKFSSIANFYGPPHCFVLSFFGWFSWPRWCGKLSYTIKEIN